MRAVIQRVRRARVVVGTEPVGEIGRGLCVLLGVAADDGEEAARRLAGRVARLRIFENDDGRFDLGLQDVRGEALGIAYFRIRRFSDAEREFRAMLELKPVDHYAHFALGRCLEKQGRRREAVPHYRLARFFRPQSKDYEQALADALDAG